MKYKTKTKLFIETILNSSETVMLNQGGMQKINIDPEILERNFDEIEISIKLDGADTSRHEFIVKAAANHLNNLTDEEIEARQRDKR
jgi:hypothetical protein